MSEDKTWPRQEPWKVGIAGRCPRCGQGGLFKGFLTLRDRCEVCGLDYSFAEPADGPAFFVLCFTCIPAMVVAVWLEVAFEPPFWVHLIVSLPLLLLFCIPPLRPLKGWLVASQFYHKAAEGRLVRPGESYEARSPEAAETGQEPDARF
ncbi:DUF983 domain-containing protein [Consotaella salsifontis]|uniref:Uncharacterized conserved protein, DUF983 family n=1 Tax=Consotaella salsifontis TaxID=1365950 RepID=A0A1T4MNF5_9HYPH|nr:DUF983 domain-containing protein [Consotaella salsifontis]SJZ68473.1 Uncharacterized conserved protein, DUF983 family [Consotaella salsifontis]